MTILITAAAVLLSELALAISLSIVQRLGIIGIRFSDALCRAPLLDVLIAVMTLLPATTGFMVASWPGFTGAIAGQLATIPVWILIHEQIIRRGTPGSRLVKAQNTVVGRWRNHTALWFSVLAVPFFWSLRIGEILLYPPLRWLLGFPKYRQGDWVNVSRHKFEGLIGHDLIWCLYCDWMTGIYSFAGEMLRNVESFWCPIRFYDGKKCENCRFDFPDIEQWAVPDNSLDPAVSLFQEKYAGGQRSWFGSTVRLTVHGIPPELENSSHDPTAT
ncbi:MAG: hypothetical protein H6813_02550 [Phycisphaeraceae bacterium]|nr:hypothetical protein [Phycisphaeraceae bacterium]MCB9848804.1 hypothetical protein [Phycisphaeraceae bacterium]